MQSFFHILLKKQKKLSMLYRNISRNNNISETLILVQFYYFSKY